MKIFDKYKTINNMDEYFIYVNTIKNIQLTENHGQSYNNYKKYSSSSSHSRKKRYEKKDYKDLDDPENSNMNSRTLISYDDL